MTHEVAPPPWIWPITGLLTLLLGLWGTHWVLYQSGAHWQGALDAYSNLLGEAAAREDGRRAVVLLGASRMMNATQSGEELTAGLRGSGVDDVDVYKIGLQGVILEDFGQLVDDLDSLEPALIVIPATVVLRDRTFENRRERTEGAFSRRFYPSDPGEQPFNLKRQSRLLVHAQRGKRTWPKPGSPREKRMAEKAWSRRDERFIYALGGRSSRVFDALLRSQVGRGGEVMVWDLPVRPGVAESYQGEHAEFLRRFKATYDDVEVLNLGPLKATSLLDFVHLNKEGRRIYSERLVRYLKRWSERGDGK